MGPPRLGVPSFHGSGMGARSRTVPSTLSHAIVPSERSTAVNMPQGGGLHGRSIGESTSSRFTDQRVGACGEISSFGSAAFAAA